LWQDAFPSQAAYSGARFSMLFFIGGTSAVAIVAF
jgi:hypothetical protein